MTARFPLIIDTADGNKVKELPNGDDLNLDGSGIVNVETVAVTGNITAGQFTMPSYTTSERNALTDVVNGQVIYNTDASKFQGYAGGAWVDLH